MVVSMIGVARGRERHLAVQCPATLGTSCVTRARGFRIIAASLAGPRIGTPVVHRALNTVTSVCLERDATKR